MLLSTLGCSQDSPTTKNQPAWNVSNAETEEAWCGPGMRGSKDTAMQLEGSLESVYSGGGRGEETKHSKAAGGIIFAGCFQELSVVKAGGAAGLGMLEGSNLNGSSEEGGRERPTG